MGIGRDKEGRNGREGREDMRRKWRERGKEIRVEEKGGKFRMLRREIRKERKGREVKSEMINNRRNCEWKGEER